LQQTFWRSQFDKLIVTFLFILMCGLAKWSANDDKLSTFALQSAAGLIGCLLTLVTSRKGNTETFLDPTSQHQTTITETSAARSVAPIETTAAELKRG
jgi:uncharacterized membrane protein YjjP (DUF1212 family)